MAARDLLLGGVFLPIVTVFATHARDPDIEQVEKWVAVIGATPRDGCGCAVSLSVSPGSFSAGCTPHCMFFSATWALDDMMNEIKENGVCDDAPGCDEEEKKDCSGKAKFSLQLANTTCCTNVYPAGIQVPEMFTGCQGPGSTKEKVFTLSAKCNVNGDDDTKTIKAWKCRESTANPPQVSVTLKLDCDNCSGRVGGGG